MRLGTSLLAIAGLAHALPQPPDGEMTAPQGPSPFAPNSDETCRKLGPGRTEVELATCVRMLPEAIRVSESQCGRSRTDQDHCFANSYGCFLKFAWTGTSDIKSYMATCLNERRREGGSGANVACRNVLKTADENEMRICVDLHEDMMSFRRDKCRAGEGEQNCHKKALGCWERETWTRPESLASRQRQMTACLDKIKPSGTSSEEAAGHAKPAPKEKDDEDGDGKVPEADSGTNNNGHPPSHPTEAVRFCDEFTRDKKPTDDDKANCVTLRQAHDEVKRGLCAVNEGKEKCNDALDRCFHYLWIRGQPLLSAAGAKESLKVCVDGKISGLDGQGQHVTTRLSNNVPSSHDTGTQTPRVEEEDITICEDLRRNGRNKATMPACLAARGALAQLARSQCHNTVGEAQCTGALNRCLEASVLKEHTDAAAANKDMALCLAEALREDHTPSHAANVTDNMFRYCVNMTRKSDSVDLFTCLALSDETDRLTAAMCAPLGEQRGYEACADLMRDCLDVSMTLMWTREADGGAAAQKFRSCVPAEVGGLDVCAALVEPSTDDKNKTLLRNCADWYGVSTRDQRAKCASSASERDCLLTVDGCFGELYPKGSLTGGHCQEAMETCMAAKGKADGEPMPSGHDDDDDDHTELKSCEACVKGPQSDVATCRIIRHKAKELLASRCAPKKGKVDYRQCTDIVQSCVLSSLKEITDLHLSGAAAATARVHTCIDTDLGVDLAPKKPTGPSLANSALEVCANLTSGDLSPCLALYEAGCAGQWAACAAKGAAACYRAMDGCFVDRYGKGSLTAVNGRRDIESCVAGTHDQPSGTGSRHDVDADINIGPETHEKTPHDQPSGSKLGPEPHQNKQPTQPPSTPPIEPESRENHGLRSGTESSHDVNTKGEVGFESSENQHHQPGSESSHNVSAVVKIGPESTKEMTNNQPSHKHARPPPTPLPPASPCHAFETATNNTTTGYAQRCHAEVTACTGKKADDPAHLRICVAGALLIWAQTTDQQTTGQTLPPSHPPQPPPRSTLEQASLALCYGRAMNATTCAARLARCLDRDNHRDDNGSPVSTLDDCLSGDDRHMKALTRQCHASVAGGSACGECVEACVPVGDESLRSVTYATISVCVEGRMKADGATTRQMKTQQQGTQQQQASVVVIKQDAFRQETQALPPPPVTPSDKDTSQEQGAATVASSNEQQHVSQQGTKAAWQHAEEMVVDKAHHQPPAAPPLPPHSQPGPEHQAGSSGTTTTTMAAPSPECISRCRQSPQCASRCVLRVVKEEEKSPAAACTSPNCRPKDTDASAQQQQQAHGTTTHGGRKSHCKPNNVTHGRGVASP